MTIKEQVAVSQEARDAAASILLADNEAAVVQPFLDGTLDNNPIVQAFARFERETLERAAKVAECAFDDRPFMNHYTETDAYERGTKDAAQAIRSLTDRK